MSNFVGTNDNYGAVLPVGATRELIMTNVTNLDTYPTNTFTSFINTIESVQTYAPSKYCALSRVVITPKNPIVPRYTSITTHTDSSTRSLLGSLSFDVYGWYEREDGTVISDIKRISGKDSITMGMQELGGTGYVPWIDTIPLNIGPFDTKFEYQTAYQNWIRANPPDATAFQPHATGSEPIPTMDLFSSLNFPTGLSQYVICEPVNDTAAYQASGRTPVAGLATAILYVNREYAGEVLPGVNPGAIPYYTKIALASSRDDINTRGCQSLLTCANSPPGKRYTIRGTLADGTSEDILTGEFKVRLNVMATEAYRNPVTVTPLVGGYVVWPPIDPTPFGNIDGPPPPSIVVNPTLPGKYITPSIPWKSGQIPILTARSFQTIGSAGIEMTTTFSASTHRRNYPKQKRDTRVKGFYDSMRLNPQAVTNYVGTSDYFLQIQCTELEVDNFAGGDSTNMLKFFYFDPNVEYTNLYFGENDLVWRRFTQNYLKTLEFTITNGSGLPHPKFISNDYIITLYLRFQ